MGKGRHGNGGQFKMKISPSRSIGIIGGRGRPGSQFARIFRRRGFKVMTTGSKDSDNNKKLMRGCDIVIFSVPLMHSTRIIEREIVYAVRKNQLLLDVSSLKYRQCRALKKAAGEVIGMHPLFGPTTEHLGQTIVLCPVQCNKETLRSLQDFFASLGIRPIVMTAEKHDHLMAVLQVLPHLKSLLVADVLHKIGGDIIDTINETATPAYRIELNLVGRFLDDDPTLYGPIILDNPETAHILALLRRSLSEITEMLKGNDLRAFAKKYHLLANFFGPQTKEGREKTEICIRTMSRLKRRT